MHRGNLMKKWTLIIFTLFLLFLADSCSRGPFKSQEKHLELMGNPTTGYTWVYSFSDEEIVHIDENIEYLGRGEVIGAPSLYMYTLTSLKPGELILNFEYKRLWENEEPESKRIYKITVREDGKIHTKEIKGE